MQTGLLIWAQKVEKRRRVVFEGLPEDLLKCERSLTGKYLKVLLQ